MIDIVGMFFPDHNKEITEILPVVDYEGECFKLKNGMLLDMLQITTKDLTGTSDDDIAYDIMCFTRFYRTYANDIKILGLNFPTDTVKQQNYVRHKISATRNEIYKEALQVKLNELEQIAKNRTDREYYLLIFSKTAEDYKNNINIVNKSLGKNGLVSTMTMEKKETILFKINNKCTTIANGRGE